MLSTTFTIRLTQKPGREMLYILGALKLHNGVMTTHNTLTSINISSFTINREDNVTVSFIVQLEEKKAVETIVFTSMQ